MQLTFEEKTHSYAIAGVTVPSVTQILSVVGLSAYEGMRDDVRLAALYRGRAVHLALSQIAKGTFSWDYLDDPAVIEAGYPPYIRAGFEWLNLSGFEPLLIEKPLCHALGYAGTPDIIGRFQGELTILDWKTGSMPWWCGIQLAGYGLALSSAQELYNYEHATRLHARLGVELKADGRAKPFPFEEYEDEDDFLAALRIARRKLNGGRR